MLNKPRKIRDYLESERFPHHFFFQMNSIQGSQDENFKKDQMHKLVQGVLNNGQGKFMKMPNAGKPAKQKKPKK